MSTFVGSAGWHSKAMNCHRRCLLPIAVAVLSVQQLAFASEDEPTVRIEGLKACYVEPATINFTVRNVSSTDLETNVAAEAKFGNEWRDAFASLTGGQARGRKAVMLTPIAAGQVLALSMDPWTPPPWREGTAGSTSPRSVRHSRRGV